MMLWMTLSRREFRMNRLGKEFTEEVRVDMHRALWRSMKDVPDYSITIPVRHSIMNLLRIDVITNVLKGIIK